MSRVDMSRVDFGVNTVDFGVNTVDFNVKALSGSFNFYFFKFYNCSIFLDFRYQQP